MRKIYMPSKDVLYQMQEKGANVYKYILTKSIESIIRCGVIYVDAGKFKFAPKYLRENKEIARAVCTLYPEEMMYSSVAQEDVELCLRLISSNPNPNSRLNELSKFRSIVQQNPQVVKEVILLLEKELKDNPISRFKLREYEWRPYQRDYSLLDEILSGRITDDRLSGIFGKSRQEVVQALVNIEPAYAINLPLDDFSNNFYNGNEYIRNDYLHKGIENYAGRYGITPSVGSEYIGQDILTRPNEDVKRLIRCIEKNNSR